jgi:hypothetical protein
MFPPAKQGIYPLDFFVVFARPDDTCRTGEKLCISFAVNFFTAKSARNYARLNDLQIGQAKRAKSGLRGIYNFSRYIFPLTPVISSRNREGRNSAKSEMRPAAKYPTMALRTILCLLILSSVIYFV